MAKQKFLSYDQVAARYRVHKNTVRNWVAKDLIHPLRLGGKVLFAEEELLRFEKESV